MTSLALPERIVSWRKPSSKRSPQINITLCLKYNLKEKCSYVSNELSPQILTSSESGFAVRALVQLVLSLTPRVWLDVSHVHLDVHQDLLYVLSGFVLTLGERGS